MLLQASPISYEDDLNLYAYVAGDPPIQTRTRFRAATAARSKARP